MLQLLLKRYWFLLLVISVSWFSLAHSELLAWNRPLIQQGEYWRIFTGNLAHGNLTHWVMNMMTLAVIYFIYDDRLSNWQFCLLSSLLAIIGGASIMLTNYHIYVGLSGVTHGLIVYGACRDVCCDKPKSGYLVLAAIAFHVTDGASIDAVLQHEHFFDGVLVVCAYLLILKPTSIVIGAVLSKYPIVNPADVNEVKTEVGGDIDTDTVTQAVTDTQTATNTPIATNSAAPITSVSPVNDESTYVSGLVAGGELIGYLERLLILTFTLVGSYAAVGFVLAAKSIFRFGELNQSANRSMTEYVLIGSLLSVVITTLIGALVSLGLGVKLK